MTSERKSATSPAALRASIHETEISIYRHRGNIAVAFEGVADGAGKKIISPGTIIAAALFGAAMQQSVSQRGLRMLSILHTVNESIRLLLNLGTPSKPQASSPN